MLGRQILCLDRKSQRINLVWERKTWQADQVAGLQHDDDPFVPSQCPLQGGLLVRATRRHVCQSLCQLWHSMSARILRLVHRWPKRSCNCFWPKGWLLIPRVPAISHEPFTVLLWQWLAHSFPLPNHRAGIPAILAWIVQWWRGVEGSVVR